MDKIANKLKNNFLFQASLGSKELFHTNLIAWLLEQKNTKQELEPLKIFIESVVKSKIGTLTDSNSPIVVREENNIDLTIKWQFENSWNLIFIENKMKSIPTPLQLQAYDLKIDKLEGSKTQNGLLRSIKKKLLLTPFQSFVQSHKTPMEWENITYEKDLLLFLKRIQKIEFLNEEETRVSLVIEKYIDFLTLLLDLLRSFNVDDNSSARFLERRYDFYAANAMQEVRSVRLHDFVLKMVHSRIGEHLKTAFKNKNILAHRFDTDFSNSTGISSVDVKIDETNFNIGLQLQGNQLRYFVYSKDKKANQKLAVQLFAQKIWFYDIDNPNIALEGQGRSPYFKSLNILDNQGKKRVFCEYEDGGFVYLYKQLDPQQESLDVKYIIDLFVRSFEHYYQNKAEILRIIKEI
jgi:hypothetical protein